MLTARLWFAGSHPHFQLWQQVGGLIVDGGVFFRARVQQQISGGKGGYEAVPDGSQKPSAGTGGEEAEDRGSNGEPAGAYADGAGSDEDLSD